VLGISEREAADAAGVTMRTYRKWEKGGHIRGMHALDNFCYELEVSICWLLDGWGSFHAEDHDEFEEYREFQARIWRERMAFIRQRSADGSLAALSWSWNGTLTDAGCVYFTNRRH
jgi:transcriptional regulator with XRE-family HTH domain